jgi:hypothetical protein
MEHKPTRQLLSLKEAGRIAGRDWRTVLGWARSGDVPGLGVEINGRVLIRRRALEELVQGQ